MYKPNPLFGGEIGPDDGQLWRYMDPGKFISLLVRNELFFVRVGVLAAAADFFEAAFPQVNYDHPERQAEALARSVDLPENPPEFVELIRQYGLDLQNLVQDSDIVRRIVYVLCWHAISFESAAMWKIYLQGNEGVAIQSTVGRLKRALLPAPGEQEIQPVRYYDPETEQVPHDILELPLWKRISFRHEQEVRAFFMDPYADQTYPTVTTTGAYVPCDVDTLIERVFVAPTSPDFFREAVQRVVHVFGLNRSVQRSSLDAPPGAPVVK